MIFLSTKCSKPPASFATRIFLKLRAFSFFCDFAILALRLRLRRRGNGDAGPPGSLLRGLRRGGGKVGCHPGRVLRSDEQETSGRAEPRGGPGETEAEPGGSSREGLHVS